MEKLMHKLIIKGQIRVETGLHIGGSAANMEIGALDQNNIIKTANGIPYIPGSSLKGKLRNMLAKAVGSKDVDEDITKGIGIADLFGVNGDATEGRTEALLRVRDAYLSDESITNLRALETDFEYSEVKYENSINRITGVANPRPLERVPKGAIFKFEMIYDCFEEDKELDHLAALSFAMEMLQYDSLGGSGTRGSGKIKFKNVTVSKVLLDTEKMTINHQKVDDDICKKFKKFNNEGKDDENCNS